MIALTGQMLVLYCSTTWFTFYSSVPLSIEPAVFSVKTTPQTRNPKVKEIPFPPMSLTLQVTLYFHFDAWMWFSYSLCFSPWQCVFPSLPSVFECLTDCLTCFCLTVSFSFFLSNSHTHKLSHRTNVLMMTCSRHVCILLYALCLIIVYV